MGILFHIISAFTASGKYSIQITMNEIYETYESRLCRLSNYVVRMSDSFRYS